MDTTTPLSASENASLTSLLPYLTVSNQAQPTSAQPDLVSRIGQQAANLPSNLLGGVLNMGANIMQMGAPDAARIAPIDVAKPYDIAPAQGLGDKLVDTGAGIVSALPSYLLPELAVGRVAGALGAGATISRIAGSAAAGAINNPEDPGTNALLMGATGGFSGLNRATRLLPQLAVGGAAAANTYAQTGSGTDAAIQGGLFGILGMLHGGEAGGSNGDVTTADSSTAPTRVAEKALTSSYVSDNVASITAPGYTGSSAADSASVFPGKSAADSAQTMLEQKYGWTMQRPGAVSGVDTSGVPVVAAPPDIVPQANGVASRVQGVNTWIASERAAGREPKIADVQRRFKLGYADAEAAVGQGRSGPTGPSEFANGVSRPGGAASAANGISLDGNLSRDLIAAPDVTSQPDVLSPTDTMPPTKQVGPSPLNPILPGFGPSGARPNIPNSTRFTTPLHYVDPTTPAESMAGPSLTHSVTLQADPTTPQVVSSAVKTPDGRILSHSTKPYAGHDEIGLEHGLIEPWDPDAAQTVPQEQRGFLVHNEDGTQQFATRDEALPYAKSAGQVPADFTNTLNSQDLHPADTYARQTEAVPEKGSGDTTPDTAAIASPENRARTMTGELPAEPPSLVDVTSQEPSEPAEPTKPPVAAAEEPVPPKDKAATSGQPDLLNGDISHFDEDTQTSIGEYRDMHNESVARGFPEDAAYALKRLGDLHGLNDDEELPELPGGPVDVPKPIVTSQKKANYQPASWIYDDAVKSSDSSYKGDTSEESHIPFSEDPAGSNKQALTSILDDNVEDLKAVLGKGEATEEGNQQALREFLSQNPMPDVENGDLGKQTLEDEDTKADKAEAEADELDDKAAVKGTDEISSQDKLFSALLKAIKDGEVNDEDLGIKKEPKKKGEAKAKRVRKPKTPDFINGKMNPDLKDKITKNEKALKARTAIRKTISGGAGDGLDGFVTRQMLGYLSRMSGGALVGGGIGYNLDKENHWRGFILGSLFLGLGAGHLPQLMKMLTETIPHGLKEQVDAVKDVTSQPGARVGDLMQNFAADPHDAKSDLLARKVLRDVALSFTRSEDVREIIQGSNTAKLQDMADDAIRGMFESGEKEKLSPAELAAYEKYRTALGSIDPATGEIVDDPMRTTRFMMDLAAHPQFAGGAVIERQVRMMQQQAIQKSGALGALKKKILATIGEYSTDSYRIFGSNWKPSEPVIGKAIESLDWLKAFPTYNKTLIGKYVGRYLEGIYQNRNLYEGGSGSEGATLDQLLKRKAQGLPPDLEKKILAAQPTAKSVDEIVTSQLYLPPELKEKLWKQIKEGNYITPQWRDLMGMYTDPAQQSVATMMKLMPAVRAAKTFEQVAAGKNALGLPFSLSPQELALQEGTIKAQLTSATDPKIKAALQRQLIDLNNRVLLPKTENLGILSDTLVSPDIANILPDMQKGLSGTSSLPVTQAILEGTKAIKLGQTLLNPISYVRWTYNAPLLGMLAGNNPLVDIPEGYRVALGKGKYGAVRSRLVDLGIMSSDIATNDFNTTAKRAMSGNLDQNILDRFLGTPFMRKAADIYGLSDNSVRAATFLRREQEMLTKLAPEVASGRVTSQEAAAAAQKDAIRYTNRYTIDYGNVPGGLSYVRKMPFVSMYLTYAYETSRILKNIIVDSTGRGPYGKEAKFGAIAKLATMSTVPAAITMGATAMMSEQDQKDWDKTKRLMQPYAQPRWLVPLGKRADGSFRYIDLTSMDPVGDWSTFGRAVASGDFKQVLASNPYIGTDNTPALNVATEIITGTNQRTGRAINTVGRAFDAARSELAPSFAGGYEFDNLMRAIQPNDQGGMGIQRLGSGKGYSLGDLLWTYATGVRPTSVNTDWSVKTAVGQAQSEITTERQFMMDTLMSNMTPEAKQQAKQRFTDAATTIIAHLKLKLDGTSN